MNFQSKKTNSMARRNRASAAVFTSLLLFGVACGDSGKSSTGSGSDSGMAGSAGYSSDSGTSSPTDSAAESAANPCPPMGPYGTKPGEIAANITLHDCDGNPVDLHDLCDYKGAFLYTFAGWCTTCKEFALSGKPNEIYNKYKNENFEMYFVVTGPNTPGAPTQADCANYQNQYGLEMTVLFDEAAAAQSELGVRVNSGYLVLSRGAFIETNTTGGSDAQSALKDIFGF